MGKFRRISTELLPLLYVEKCSVFVLYLGYFSADSHQTHRGST